MIIILREISQFSSVTVSVFSIDHCLTITITCPRGKLCHPAALTWPGCLITVSPAKLESSTNYQSKLTGSHLTIVTIWNIQIKQKSNKIHFLPPIQSETFSLSPCFWSSFPCWAAVLCSIMQYNTTAAATFWKPCAVFLDNHLVTLNHLLAELKACISVGLHWSICIYKWLTIFSHNWCFYRASMKRMERPSSNNIHHYGGDLNLIIFIFNSRVGSRHCWYVVQASSH